MPTPTPPTPTPTPPTPTLPRASLPGWLTSLVGWPPTPAAPVVPTSPPWPTAQSPPMPPPRMLAQHEVALPSEGGPCRLVPAANRELRTRTLRFGHSSPASPPCQLEYDLVTRQLSLLQQEGFSPGGALGRRIASWCAPRAAEAGAIAKAGGASAVLGAAPSAVALPWLHCELRHVTTEDGTLVPVTLLHLTLTLTTHPNPTRHARPRHTAPPARPVRLGGGGSTPHSAHRIRSLCVTATRTQDPPTCRSSGSPRARLVLCQMACRCMPSGGQRAPCWRHAAGCSRSRTCAAAASWGPRGTTPVAPRTRAARRPTCWRWCAGCRPGAIVTLRAPRRRRTPRARSRWRAR